MNSLDKFNSKSNFSAIFCIGFHKNAAYACKIRTNLLIAFIFTHVRMMIQTYLDVIYRIYLAEKQTNKSERKESKNDCIDIRTRQTCVIRETCASEMQPFHLGRKSDAYGTGNSVD